MGNTGDDQKAVNQPAVSDDMGMDQKHDQDHAKSEQGGDDEASKDQTESGQMTGEKKDDPMLPPWRQQDATAGLPALMELQPKKRAKPAKPKADDNGAADVAPDDHGPAEAVAPNSSAANDNGPAVVPNSTADLQLFRVELNEMAQQYGVSRRWLEQWLGLPKRGRGAGCKPWPRH